MDIILSLQFLDFVISSSSCLIRGCKSKEEGLAVGWVGGGDRDCSGSLGLNEVLEALFKVIVSVGFEIWSWFRTHLSWRAVQHGGSIVKGTGREEGKRLFVCRRKWASSSSSWWIVAHSLRHSCFSVLRSAKNWACSCWTAWRYWNCFMLASGKVWIRGFVCSSACSEAILGWSTWVVNRCSIS